MGGKRTENARIMNQRLKAYDRWREEVDLELYRRPRTRADCIKGPRPCPWASCRHHLALDINKNGSITHFLAEDAHSDSCSLDIADRGGLDRAAVASMLGVSGESVRQYVKRATEKMGAAMSHWDENEEEEVDSMRRSA